MFFFPVGHRWLGPGFMFFDILLLLPNMVQCVYHHILSEGAMWLWAITKPHMKQRQMETKGGIWNGIL